MRSPRFVALACVLALAFACSSNDGTSPPARSDPGSPDSGDPTQPTDNGFGPKVPGGTTLPPSLKPDVTVFHKNPSKDGVYVDTAMTKDAASKMHRDPGFAAMIQGPVFAQPLYVENGANGKETVYVATEQDIVYALDAATGAVLWQHPYGLPVPQRAFDCANIDPIGITGTPVIDLDSRTMFFDAMTLGEDGTSKHHMLHGVSIDDGHERKGYPVDVQAQLGAQGFDAAYNQQRGGLLFVKGGVYVPYGGFAGDCGPYHGMLVGWQIENPGELHQWQTKGVGGGIWGPGGPSTDGSAIYVATGNADNPDTFTYADAILKLGVGPTFSEATADWFSPSNRQQLDAQDLELGSVQPVPFDLPGMGSGKLLVAFGKMGNGYVIDRTNLGGVGTGDGTRGEGIASAHLTSNYIITSPAVFATAKGTYAVIKGQGMDCPTGTDMIAVHVKTDPPGLETAWCVDHHGEGSPIVTTTDGKSEAIVWAIGAEGDTKLHAWDAETGAVLFDGGEDTLTDIARYQTPIEAKGRVYWASNSEVIAFTSK